MKQYKKILSAFLSGAIIGFSIWFFSKQITGHIEPWDGEGIMYAMTLVIGGIVTQSMCGKLWVGYVSLYLGQLACMLYYDKGFIIMGAAFLLVYLPYVILGALSVMVLRGVFKKVKNHPK